MFTPIAGSQLALNAQQRSADFGRVGVLIFFCVSGMLIPTNLRGTPRGDSRRLLIRRFLRLYPAFWLPLPIGNLAYSTLFGAQMNMASLVANVTMIPSALGKIPVMGTRLDLVNRTVFLWTVSHPVLARSVVSPARLVPRQRRTVSHLRCYLGAQAHSVRPASGKHPTCRWSV
jgi:peptidoglycan/LPS O-acetylase OafA/YrhL